MRPAAPPGQGVGQAETETIARRRSNQSDPLRRAADAVLVRERLFTLLRNVYRLVSVGFGPPDGDGGSDVFISLGSRIVFVMEIFLVMYIKEYNYESVRGIYFEAGTCDVPWRFPLVLFRPERTRVFPTDSY